MSETILNPLKRQGVAATSNGHQVLHPSSTTTINNTTTVPAVQPAGVFANVALSGATINDKVSEEIGENMMVMHTTHPSRPEEEPSVDSSHLIVKVPSTCNSLLLEGNNGSKNIAASGDDERFANDREEEEICFDNSQNRVNFQSRDDPLDDDRTRTPPPLNVNHHTYSNDDVDNAKNEEDGVVGEEMAQFQVGRRRGGGVSGGSSRESSSLDQQHHRQQERQDGSSRRASTFSQMEDEGCCGTASIQRKLERRIIKAGILIQRFLAFTPVYRTSEEIAAMDVPTSLFIFRGDNPVRLFCLRMIQYSVFRTFILLCILVNSVLLALDEPLRDRSATLVDFMDVMDKLLTSVFVVEMILKVIALGFILHRGSYLQNGWNVLDFIIVVTSALVSFADLGGNFSALRVVRVLRPLRSINRVVKLKRLISGIFHALPAVADNFFLFVFILFIFAIGGLQLFLDDLSTRCYIEEAPTTADLSAVSPAINLTMFVGLTFPQLDQAELRLCGGERECAVASVQTSSDSGAIEVSTVCAEHRDIFYGRNLNFDNLLGAMLLTIKIMTGDNWPEEVQNMIDSSGITVTVCYFVLLVTIGSFFCVNLFLAILTSSYGDDDDSDDGNKDSGKGAEINGVASPTTFGDFNNEPREIIVEDGIVNQSVITRIKGRAPIKDTYVQCEIEHEGAYLETQLDAIEKEFCNIDEEETRRRVQILIDGRHQRPPSADSVEMTSTTDPSHSISSCRSALKGESSPVHNNIIKDEGTSASAKHPQRVSRRSFLLANKHVGSSSRLGSFRTPPSTHTERSSEKTDLPLRRRRQSSRVLSPPLASNLAGVDTFVGSAAPSEFSRDASGAAMIELEFPIAQEAYETIFTEDISEEIKIAFHAQQKIEMQQRRAIEGGPSVAEQVLELAEAEDDLIDTSDDADEGDSAGSFGTSASGLATSSRDSSSAHPSRSNSSLSTKASQLRRRRREKQKNDDRAEWRKAISKFVDSKPVVIFMTFITVLNVVLLMADHYGIDPDVLSVFDIIGIACTALFALEIALKLVSLGVYRTLKNKLNVLDLLLVIISVPDMILSGGSSAFSALRVIRLLRLLRLLKSFPSMQIVFGSAARSVVGSGYLMLLVGLFLFVYAILGMQLFGSFYGVDDDDIRDSYGTFLPALLVSFIVVTGENWTDKMRVAMSHSTSILDDGIAVMYFVSLFMIGNYILINLFVAIIMDKLEEEYESMRIKRERQKRRNNTSDVLVLPTLILPNLAHSTRDIPLSSRPESLLMYDDYQAAKRFADEAERDYNRFSQRAKRFMKWLLKYELVPCGDGRSLYLFHPDNIFRKACRVALGSRLYNICLISLLVANVVFIAFDGQPEPLSTAVDSSEEIFCGIFIAEMLINIVAYGLFFPRGLSKAEIIIELHAARKLKADEEDRLKQDEMRNLEEFSTEAAANAATTASHPSIQSEGSDRVRLSQSEERTPLVSTAVTTETQQHNSSISTAVSAPVTKPLTKTSSAAVASVYSQSLGNEAANGTPLLSTSLERGQTETSPPTTVVNISSNTTRKGRELEEVESPQLHTKHSLKNVSSLPLSSQSSGEFKVLDSPDYKGSWVVGPAYLRDWFNVVDATVAITSLIGLFVPTFKIFRSIRTIRLLNNIESTRVVTVALIRAVGNVFHGLIVVLFIFVVFAVMGVQFFKGKFFRCNDPSVYLREDCVGNFTTTVQGVLFEYPEVQERTLESITLNFDHIGESFISIFVVAVGDGWSTIMFNAMDTTTEGNGLRFESSTYYALFFVIAFMCTNFFALNMIVGIFISYFSKMKRENDGSLILTPKQRMFIKARSAIEASMSDVDVDPANNAVSKGVHWFINVTLPQPPEEDEGCCGSNNPVARLLRSLLVALWKFFTRQSIFDFGIMIVVVINTVFVATVHAGMSDSHNSLLTTVNTVGLCIYTAEAVIKLVAYFPAQYFLVAWNTFDFLIVAVGWVDFSLPGIPAVAFLRVLRVAKLLRGTGVQRLINTVLLSVRSFINVILLFILNLFIFSAAGVVLFKDVRLTGFLSEHVNFRTVPNALLLLFEIVTTESWADAMDATYLTPPNCNANGDDCGHRANVAFFLIFMVCGNFVTLQLFVAVIVETFEEAVSTWETAPGDEDEDEGIDNAGWVHETPADILGAFKELRVIWTERFDKNRQRITVAEFVALLPYLPSVLTMSDAELRGEGARNNGDGGGGPSQPAATGVTEDPLENGIHMNKVQRPSALTQNLLKEAAFLIRFLASLSLPVDSEGMVQYRDVVYSLAYRKFNIDVRTYANMLHTTLFVFQASFTAAEQFCAEMIQQRWRLYKERKRETRV